MDETWYTDVTSQKDDKKVIKVGGHRACFVLKVNFTLQSWLNFDKPYSTLFQSVPGVISSGLYYLVKFPKNWF